MGDLIKHSLDLAINLIDTTTGRHVGDSSVEFIFDKELMPRPIPRGSGTFIIMGFGRENFHMQIKLKGYETAYVDVDYEKLDKRLPLQNVFLIPCVSPLLSNDVISLKGNLFGLSELALVRMIDVRAHSDAYDAKKRILTVFEKGNRLNMEGSPFGIIGSDKDHFEIIEIVDQKADDKVILKDPLMEEFFRNAPIARIIFGYVNSDGDYNISVRNDGADLRCILRYTFNGKTNFMKVDFHKIDDDFSLSEMISSSMSADGGIESDYENIPSEGRLY